MMPFQAMRLRQGGATQNFPTVVSTNTGGAIGASSQAITFSGSIVIGELLLVIFVNDSATPTSITGTGWASLVQRTSPTTDTLSVYWKIADGSDSLTITYPTEDNSYIAYRISGAAGATAISAVSGAHTMPTCTPVEGSQKWLWFCAWAMAAEATVTSAPSGYSANLTNNPRVNGGNGIGCSAAWRTNQASSESPGAYSVSIGPSTDAIAVIAVIPSGATYSDPSYANVISLINPIGADGSTSIIDAKGKIWTPGGNAQIDTAYQWAGFPTMLFDGSGDYFQTPDSSDWSPGSGDFTFEAIVRFATDQTPEPAVIAKWNTSPTEWFFGRSTAGTGYNQSFYYNNGGNVFTNSSLKTPLNLFAHMSFSRVGNTGYYHLRGIQAGTINMTGHTITNTAEVVRLGLTNNGNNGLNGHVAPIRTTMGVGRYGASDYTPIAIPFATS